MMQETNSLPPYPSLAGKRVMVTGGMGFIGSNLASRCLQLGATVTIFDCLDPVAGGNFFNISNIAQDAKLVFGDIRNFDGLAQAIYNQDILFNCAAYTSHPNSMEEPRADIEVNCLGIINILEAARRFNPGMKIVHVGTSTQIGRMRTSPINEEHCEFPADIYSANRSAAEKYVLIYGTAHKMPVTVVRLSNVYGPRACINSAEFGFINFFIGLALQGKNLTVFEPGTQLRNFTYVDDCVRALIMAAVNHGCNGEVLFAVSDDHYSVRQAAEAVVEVIGGKLSMVAWPQDRAKIEIGDAVISNEKIKRCLGWEPFFDLREGLRATKEYYLEYLPHYIG